jgi:hypothetical protein
MAPRSTALAGAQLAARQLNCESVFRGVLSYGRGRNNARAGFLGPFATRRMRGADDETHMKQYEKYAGNNFVLHIFLHRVDEIAPRCRGCLPLQWGLHAKPRHGTAWLG